MEGTKGIGRKIALFKRKYYQNLIIRGAILVPAILLGCFLIATVVEYNLWLGRTSRFLIFISFIASIFFLVIVFFKKPLNWLLFGKGLNEQGSAKIIGN